LHLEGTYVLNCPRNDVWKFISDPQKIAQCLPDLQRLDVKDGKHFAATMKVGVVFVRGTLKFDFTLIDQTPPSHSTFEALGKGAGVSLRLNATMDLKEIGAGTTELAWRTEVQLGGLLGEISPSIIQNSTDKMTRQFFACIKAQLEPNPSI
jgi:uncharacterized protein